MKGIMEYVDERLASYTPISQRIPVIVSQLETAARSLNSIEYINEGGCAFVALGLQEKFKAEGIPVDVVFLLSNSMQQRNWAAALKLGEVGSCSHAVIKHGIYYYDSRGRYTLTELQDSWRDRECIPVTTELAQECVRDHSLWNKAFNRDSGVPYIEKVLEVSLAKECL